MTFMSVILLSFSDNKETNSAKGAEETGMVENAGTGSGYWVLGSGCRERVAGAG